MKNPVSPELIPEAAVDVWIRCRQVWPGAAKGGGVTRAVGGVRGQAPVPVLLALAPRPLAVAKPKGDAWKKATPKGGVVKPAGKAKGVLKGRALAGAAVVLPLHFRALRVPGTAPAPAAEPPIATGLPPGFAMPAFHGGLHPAAFTPYAQRRFHTTCGSGCGSPTGSVCVTSRVCSQRRWSSVVS